jgi:hypothetical protein
MPGHRPRALVVNPTLRIAALVESSRRGRGRRQLEVTDPAAVAFLLGRLAGRSRVRPTRDVRRRLETLGVLIPPRLVPRDVHLDARLDVDPRTAGNGSTPAAWTAGWQLHRGPGVPAPLARGAGVLEPFLPAGPIVWARRPGSGIVLPYTPTPGLARAIRASRARVTPSAQERQAWARRMRGWRRQLRGQGFVVLRDLFERRFLDAVRRYYRRLEREGYLLGGERRRRGAPLLYDEPLLVFLAAQLGPVVAAITGEPARPALASLRVHDPGAILARHLDRPFWRWTVDLIVGGDPSPRRSSAWPLWMEGRRRTEAVRLALGDAVLYRGDRVRHWRGPQPRRRTTVVASLYYGRRLPEL